MGRHKKVVVDDDDEPSIEELGDEVVNISNNPWDDDYLSDSYVDDEDDIV